MNNFLELTVFRFTSEGPKGKIKKVIEFSPYEETIWNLGFGDEKEGDWEVSIVSDIDDLRKVIQTVANAAHHFTEKYPERRIFINPVDERRKLLYNRLFKEKFEEILLFFNLEGVDLSAFKIYQYEPSRIYDAFVLSRKKSIFETQTSEK